MQKDPLVANKLRSEKIIKWAMGDRPLVSMVNIAFKSAGIPSRALIYGFVANRKGFNFGPPASFFNKYLNLEFIKTLFPRTPKPDHWSDSNTLNYAPAIIALMVLKGKNVYDFVQEFKKSELGILRSDLFALRNHELEKRIAFKLLELRKFDQASRLLIDLIKKIPYENLEFPVKILYCSTLARVGKVESEKEFCQKVAQEKLRLERMNKANSLRGIDNKAK